jgi:hypothetical protein
MNSSDRTAVVGKYVSLTKHLRSLPTSEANLTLSFRELESILAFSIPPSARKHRPWWGNQRHKSGRPQAQGWMEAGFVVDAVNIKAGTVRFVRNPRFADRIRRLVALGTAIPKPETEAEFLVRGWGQRRGEPALIYSIPNHRNPSKPHEKGITESEFEKAFSQLEASGKFTRAWFNEHLPACAKEGPCNYTTIGGMFQLLGEARYASRGVYERCLPNNDIIAARTLIAAT